MTSSRDVTSGAKPTLYLLTFMSSNPLNSAMLLTRAEIWFPGLRLCFFLTHSGQISTTDVTLVSQLKVTVTRSS